MTVVTDVVARLRADTSHFNRGFASAAATVKSFEATTAAAEGRVTSHTSRMATSAIRMSNDTQRAAALYRSSLGQMGSTSSGLASAVQMANTTATRSHQDAAERTEASLERSRSAMSRQRISLGQVVTGALAASAATRDLDGEFSGMGQSVGRLSGSVAVLGGAMKGIGIAAGIGFAAVGVAMAGASMKGIQAAAQYEQTVLAFESSFKAMGRTAQDAQKYLVDLRDFAAKTPFELTGLLNSVRGLMTIGKTPETILNDLLPAIGDMAAMMGVGEEAIGRVVFAFRQISGSPKVLAQDLYQIQNALPGFNAKMGLANDAILAMAGGFEKGNIAEYQRAVESGAISGAEAVDALVRAMVKFPGAANMMEKQSATLTGVLSTFKDEVNNALIDGFAPAIPAISSALVKLVPAMKNVTTGFAQAMGPALATLVNEVGPAFINLSKTLGPVIGQLISGFAPVISSLLPLIGAIAESVGGVMIFAFQAIRPVIEALVPPIQNFLTVLAASLGPVIKALGPALTVLAQTLGQLLYSLTPLLPSLSELLVASIQMVPSTLALSIAMNQLVTALMPLIQLFVQLVVLTMRYNPMMKLMQIQTSLVARAISALAGFLAPLVTRLMPIFNSVLRVFVGLMAVAAAGVKVLAGVISIGLSAAFTAGMRIAKQFGSWVVSQFKSAAALSARAWDFLKNALPKPVRNAISSISDAINRFGKWITSTMRSVGKSAMGALRDGFESLMPGFLGSITSAVSSAVQIFNAAGDSFNAVGQNNASDYVSGFQRVISKFAGNPNVGKALDGLIAKAPAKIPVPAVAGAPATSDSGSAGSAGSADKAKVEIDKWFTTIKQLNDGLKQMAKGGLNKRERDQIVNRSRELIEAFSGEFTIEKFRARIDLIAKSSKGMGAAIDALTKQMSTALNKFTAAAASSIETVRKGIERMRELSMRAFDADTSAQSQNIRNAFQNGSTTGETMMNWATASAPDLGAVFDVGDGGLADSLESSIASMRTGLSDALTGLFGSGGQMDMSMRAINTRFTAAMKAIEQSRNDAISAANTARDDEYKAAQTRREGLTPAEQSIKDLNEQSNVENLQRNKASAEADLEAAQKIRNTKRRNEAIQEAQRRLNEALRAIQLDTLAKEAEVERKAREDAYVEEITEADRKYNDAVTEADRLYTVAQESATREYDRQVEANRVAEEEAVRNNEFIREEQRRTLDTMFDNLVAQLDKKRVNWAKFNTDLKAITGNPAMKKALENSGLNLGKAFADGLDLSKNKIEEALEKIAKLVKQYLKLNSPSELGPMSDMNKWWRAFGDTLIDGVDEKAFAKKLGKAVSSIPANVNIGMSGSRGDYMSIMPYPNAKGAGAPVTIQVTVQGSVIQERDLAESIREELVKIGRRDGTIFGGIV